MTIEQLRKLPPGTAVVWKQDGEPATMGHVGMERCPDLRKAAQHIIWEDGQRTEDYDDWALEYVEVVRPS